MKTTGLLLLTFVTMAIAVPNCPSGWTYFQGNCYRWYDGPQRLSWKAAQSFCAEEASKDCSRNCDSNLVSIHSAKENEFLLNYWRTSRGPEGKWYWTGYREIGNSDQFDWSDGSKSVYENWDAGQPSDRSQASFCGVMWKGPNANQEDIGKWDDQPCSRLSPFICKFSVSC